MATEVQCSVNYHSTHLIDRQCVILRSVILDGGNIDIYLARDDMLAYPTLALLEGNDIGKVVVTYKVAIHLTMVLRATEDIVDIAHLVALAIDNLLKPTT